MNELDAQIIQSTNGCLFLKRFIDDIFLAWTSELVTGDMLLETANNLNDAIKFTIELPSDNQLPYLDTLVSFHPTTNTFSTTLYIKPIHSTCITPWDSHGSVASKRSIIIGETRRAISRSTNSTEINKSLRKITSTFINNGYPKQFVRSVIQQTLHTEPQREKQENCVYLKLPYINEEFRRHALATIRRSGMENIRVHFMNGQPISRVYAPNKERLHCNEDCDTCNISVKRNQCHIKNTVYLVECLQCQAVYIGETSRTIRSRIKEHLRMNKQTLFIHLENHNINPRANPFISWKILHKNIRYEQERKIFEAFEIRRYADKIMNGCVGRILNI